MLDWNLEVKKRTENLEMSLKQHEPEDNNLLTE